MECTETESPLDDHELLKRMTLNPGIFGGKPITRDMRFAVEHVLGKLASGDSVETILDAQPNA